MQLTKCIHNASAEPVHFAIGDTELPRRSHFRFGELLRDQQSEFEVLPRHNRRRALPLPPPRAHAAGIHVHQYRSRGEPL